MMKQRSLFSALAVLPLAIGISVFAPQVFAQASAVEASVAPAEYSVASLLGRYPADSIQTDVAAKAALKDVQEARDEIEARYAAEQRACYPKFFTTRCLDKATERRRQDLADVRKIEVEANAYLRKAKVVERDRKLAEKAAQNESDAAQRAQQAQQHDATVSEHADQNERAAAGKEAQRQKRAADAERKREDHAQREQEREAHASKDAEQREENVAKYNKKLKDAQARQADVAKKKAQRERERAVKAEKAAKQSQQDQESIVPAK
jgi:colicin import membrane protein